MQLLQEQHEIVAVATAREAPEYATTAQDFLAWARERDIPAIGSAEPPREWWTPPECP